MYPCADGATPLPGICGWRHILCPANFVDVAQEAIEAWLSSKPPPAVRHHRLPPKLLPVKVRATPSIPTSKDRLLASPSNEFPNDQLNTRRARRPPGIRPPGPPGPPGPQPPEPHTLQGFQAGRAGLQSSLLQFFGSWGLGPSRDMEEG